MVTTQRQRIGTVRIKLVIHFEFERAGAVERANGDGEVGGLADAEVEVRGGANSRLAERGGLEVDGE